MGYRKVIGILALLLSVLTATAQQFTLSGKVSDEEGNAIELATVSCLEQGAVTMANLKGEFSLKLHSADSVVVKFSMVGYQTRTRVLRKPKGNQKMLVTLHPMKELDEVVVTERRRQTTATAELDTKDLRATPTTSGNAVEELVQQQAGVSSHNELSSQYNVRGGSFDENFVYINNVEVYRPLLIRSGQQEGLSVINSDMVERIAFSSGGFEAKYGDKIAVGVDARDGRVAVKGWLEVTDIGSVDFCRKMRDAGVGTIIYTDISKDGAMQGTNMEIYRKLNEIEGLDIMASGGISSESEVAELAQFTYGAILGKALYDGVLDLAHCIELAGPQE